MRMELNGKTYVDQPGLAAILNNTVKCLAAWQPVVMGRDIIGSAARSGSI